ncbi:gas vesicle protein [Streptomyces sp. NPDC088766]|uniref:gas vesicle protein GvpO n=1 Tax=Streptomyces sp. NPDC088766 TaxID=3365893 RepID=UPI0037F8E83D
MSNTKNTADTQASRNARTSRRRPKGGSPTDDQNEGRDDTVTDDRPKPMEVLRQARAQLAELTGMTAESVSSFSQTENGWSLEVEVLELERVPDTMSLMGSYEVELDPEGQLTGYRRVRRYERGRADARPGGR